MYNSKVTRTCMALYYGWGHAGELAQNHKHSRLWYYGDILHYFFKYGLGSQRYILYRFDTKTKEEKDRDATLFYQKVFVGRDKIIELRKFIAKWSGMKYQTTRRMMGKRVRAYSGYFHTGEHLFVEYGVIISAYHHRIGKLSIGEKVALSRNCDLDITGDLTIGNKVSISDGAKILTHSHDLDNKFRQEATDVESLDTTRGCAPTPLIINDNVWIGAHAIIMPGVSEIGRSAVVAAGAIVEKSVPPYAIVKGNPAKIVGFRCAPEVAARYEEANYPPEQRIPYETLKANYEKYFNAERRKEIRQWLKY